MFSGPNILENKNGIQKFIHEIFKRTVFLGGGFDVQAGGESEL
jgi:hypothetical protein